MSEPAARSCNYFCVPGGIGVQVGQPLIRFIGSSVELRYLLSGHLSFTKTCEFPDAQEAAPTEADIEFNRRFNGNNTYLINSFLRRTVDIRCETFVSCWHQLTSKSQLDKLYSEYACRNGVEMPFWCIVKTSEQHARLAFQEHSGSDQWTVHLERVRYLKSETQRREDLLHGWVPMCPFPDLFFKRKDRFDWEQEARFVLHEMSAGNLRGTRRERGLLPFPDKYLYVSVTSEEFVDRVFFTNESSFLNAKVVVPDIEQRFDVSLSTRAQAFDVLMASAPPHLEFEV